SISPVPMIWLSAPSSSQGQNADGGHGSLSPEASSTKARNSSENGKPNRKRMLVAPQVPTFAVNERCIALRATWPAEATHVKGTQRAVMENMKRDWAGETPRHRAGRAPCGQQGVLDSEIAGGTRIVSAYSMSSRRTPPMPLRQGSSESRSHHLLRDHHVVD